PSPPSTLSLPAKGKVPNARPPLENIRFSTDRPMPHPMTAPKPPFTEVSRPFPRVVSTPAALPDMIESYRTALVSSKAEKAAERKSKMDFANLLAPTRDYGYIGKSKFPSVFIWNLDIKSTIVSSHSLMTKTSTLTLAHQQQMLTYHSLLLTLSSFFPSPSATSRITSSPSLLLVPPTHPRPQLDTQLAHPVALNSLIDLNSPLPPLPLASLKGCWRTDVRDRIE
ncbi:hypothetical protein P7C70_g6600, partial [Phenoliferia sp. Uapishka_3]